MKQTVKKSPKIALCRECHGTGVVKYQGCDGIAAHMTCPQCGGSGRVLVSCEMTLDIRPYQEHPEHP